MSWLLMSLSPWTPSIGPFLIVLWVDLACLTGLGGVTFLITVKFVSGSSWLLVFCEPWCRNGSIPHGCPLSMVFIVALYVPWYRHLEVMPGVKPQLDVDNFKCSAERPGALFDAARFTSRCVRAVGQDVSPGKCVLLSTSKSVRKAMKLWNVSGDGRLWKIQLGLRDLGHLDFIRRARAGTLSKRVGEATVGVAAVGALPLGFQVKLGLVRGKYLLAGVLVPLGLLLCELFGPVRCLLPALLRFLTCVMGLLVLILRFILFGPGFA